MFCICTWTLQALGFCVSDGGALKHGRLSGIRAFGANEGADILRYPLPRTFLPKSQNVGCGSDKIQGGFGPVAI
jgi:hypothetical protein